MPPLSWAWRHGRACLSCCDAVHTSRPHRSVRILGLGKNRANEKSTVKIVDTGFDVGREVVRDASTRKLAMTSFA